jgi:hypothetical protein
MRIAFIDHSYHKQTLSTRFFLDLISDLGDIKLFYDDSWRDGKMSGAPSSSKMISI